MRKEDRDIYVDTSHVGLRTLAFGLALVVAVGAIAYGFSRLGHKDPGYYEIECDPNDAAPRYRNGITLTYYFDGDSSEIKARMNALKELYTGVLLRSYQLLDNVNTYDGYVNLATLNADLLEDGRARQQVSSELLWVLQDLWDRSRQGGGVSLFSGAMYDEWDAILGQEDMTDFDPATNPDVAGRIQALADATDQEAFSVTFAGDVVEVEAPTRYLAFLADNEYSTALLTTGRLTEAYRLNMIRTILEENGFTNGYLATDSGLILSLSGHAAGQYVLYGLSDGQPARYATLEGGANTACSLLRSFSLEEGELMYHVVEGRYYHPNYDVRTGTFQDSLSSVCAVRYDGDIVTAAWEALELFGAGQLDPDSDAVIAYTLAGTEDRVYSNAPQRIAPTEGVTVESLF